MTTAIAERPVARSSAARTLRYGGRLDQQRSRRLERSLVSAFERGGADIRVDLTRAHFVGADAIAVLLEAQIVARRHNRRLHVACASGPVRSLLDLCGVTESHAGDEALAS